MVMYEYEFRLIVQSSLPFTHFFEENGLSTRKQVVYYLKPHFRFKNGNFEKKRVKFTQSVYHDNVWFKWVCSAETPYNSWGTATCQDFLHQLGNFQDPLTKEIRDYAQIDKKTQIYAFKKNSDYYLVFEWEYGTFKKRLTKIKKKTLLKSLSKHERIYKAMTVFSTPFFKLNEEVVRKPVTCISEISEGNQYLYAHKLDGIFGLVYSYKYSIKEKWEGYECVMRRGVTLGDGFVFSAEKMDDGRVVLLDVYQVRGHDTASWCRRDILSEFLPNVKLIEGYFVQMYFSKKNDLTLSIPPFKTDGVIVHDVRKDVVFKCKSENSIDLVYFKGYFQLPNGRIKCLENNLEDGRVYEISTVDGRVIRKRIDRFKGNSDKQIKNVLALGWHGPPIEYT